MSVSHKKSISFITQPASEPAPLQPFSTVLNESSQQEIPFKLFFPSLVPSGGKTGSSGAWIYGQHGQHFLGHLSTAWGWTVITIGFQLNELESFGGEQVLRVDIAWFSL